MGIYDRPYYRDESRPSGFRLQLPQTAVGLILLINVAVHLAVLLTNDRPTGPAGQKLMPWLTQILILTPANLTQPWLWWKFLTCGFLHDPDNWQHLVFNMLALYIFGRDVEAIYGRKRFWHVYLLALVMGSVIWACLHFNASPVLLGASGAVNAILILFCLHFPQRLIYIMGIIPAPAWVVGIMYVLLDLSGYVHPRDHVAYEVHLVGAMVAVIYFRFGRSMEQVWSDWTSPLWNAMSGRKLKVYRGSEDIDRLAAEADRILEKMHRQGEASLTAAERRILESYSRHMRENRR